MVYRDRREHAGAAALRACGEGLKVPAEKTRRIILPTRSLGFLSRESSYSRCLSDSTVQDYKRSCEALRIVSPKSSRVSFSTSATVHKKDSGASVKRALRLTR